MTQDLTPRSNGEVTREATPATNDSTEPSRVPPGRLRNLGPVTWIVARIAALMLRVPKMHLFNTLGQHGTLFWSWCFFAGFLLSWNKLPKRDTELVILRVGHLRTCEYELQHHRRIGKRRGLDDAKQAAIFAGPDADGLSDRERALVTATDEIVLTRDMSTETWEWLSRHLTRKQLIEFVTLAGQYDALAATLITLRVPLDYPPEARRQT